MADAAGASSKNKKYCINHGDIYRRASGRMCTALVLCKKYMELLLELERLLVVLDPTT